MGLLDFIKEIYYSWEEKYYKFLDAIDEKIPVYKIIDPIDKVVPSFALFLAIAFILLLLIFFGVVLPFFMPKLTTLSVSVIDKDGTGIAGAEVIFSIDGKEVKDTTANEYGIATLENLSKGVKVNVVAKKENYLTEEQDFEISDVPKQNETIILKSKSEGYTTKIIRLMDSSGMSPSGSFTLNFSCPDNPYATPPASITLSASNQGIARVNVPNNCGRLFVSVKDTVNYQEIISREVLSDDFTIMLSAIEQLKGKLKVYVKAENGNALEGKKVTLYKYSEIAENPYAGPIDYAYTSNGYALFEWPAGDYIVRVYDASGTYADAEYKDEYGNNIIRIEAESEKTITITMKEGIIGKIKIKAIDKTSKAPIDNASIRLEYASDNSPVETLTTDVDDNNGTVIFNISRDVEYSVFISAAGYASKRFFGIRKSDAVVEKELERCTPSTCGTLLVKVIDQDGKAIEGASVTIYDYYTNSMAYSGFKATDINGIVKFMSIKEGSYYAYAYKGSNTAKSVCNNPKDCYFDSLQSDDGVEDLTVVMDIPNGTLRFVVRDADGKAVAHARILVYDDRTNDIIMQNVTDINGTLSFETKADKKVYARVVTDDAPYKASYTTASRAVVANDVVEFDITMVPPIINKPIEIESLGLYKDGKKAITVAPNQEYTAKFLLKIPENRNYTMAGVHIRTGEEIIMEKDKLYIKSINIPKASIIKAAYYDESSGLEAEDYEVTAGDSKWFNAVWQKPILSGLYEIEVVVYVKGNASVGDKLSIHYRAVAEDGEIERFPQDAKVSIDLYAETKTDWYEVGSMTLCDSDFCFAASILDIKEDLVEPVSSAPYLAKPFNEYVLKFALTNNSDRVHNLANLRISNPDKSLLIEKYSFTVAGGIEKSQDGLNDYEIPRIDLGDFRKNDTVTAHEIYFIPQKSGEGIININLVSDKSVVWNKSISISVASPNELDLVVSPNIFNIGIENDINVLVLDKETGLEVESAIVKLLDKHDYIMQATTTAKDGYAYLTLPSSGPGTKYKVVAEKEGYDKAEILLEVNNELISFNPKSIGINLNSKTKVESDEIVNISNLSGFNVKIVEATLKGNFKSLLDLTKTQNALKSAYENYTIEPNDKLEMHLSTFLSEEGKLVEEPITIEGKLLVAVENFGKRWSYELPVKITIGIGGEVDSPDCLTLTRKEWNGVTEGQPIVIEFEIQNNCSIQGKPVELRRLEGKITWKSNQLGKYIIKIGDNETELMSGYYKTLFQRLPAEGRHVAVLKFVPYGGVSGTAEAEISLRASNPLEEKEQVLESKIASKIGIENVKDCVTFDKEYIVITQGEEQAEAKEEGSAFSIRVEKNCAMPYDIKLESDLKLSRKEETISPGGSKTITVFPEDKYAGQYPIFVKARMQGEASFKLIETIKVVIVKPGCIQLNRYEFDIYDNPKDEFDGYDTAELTNLCAEKVVDVKVDMKDWGKAMKDGLGWGLLTIGLGLLSGKGLTGDKQKNASDYSNNLRDCLENYGNDLCDFAGTSANSYGTVCTGRVIKKYKDGTVCCKTACVQSTTQNATQTTGNQGSSSQNISQNTSSNNENAEPKYEGVSIKNNDGSFSEPNYDIFETADGRYIAVPSGEKIDSKNGFEVYVDEQGAFSRQIQPIIIPEIILVGGGFFGGSEGIFGIGSGLVDGILGGGSAISQGAKAFLIGTIVSYYQQEETFEFKSTQKDLELKDVKLLRGEGAKEVEEKEILLEKEKTSSETDPKNPQLKVEKTGLKFINKAGITTTELEPRYDLLKVLGIRHNYADKKYKKKDFEIEKSGGIFGFFMTEEKIKTENVKLDEEEPDDINEKFHIEFNAVPPEAPRSEDKSLLNCQAGTRTGTTGEAAFVGEKAPLKVKLKWDWKSIAENECDEGNENFVYCDATQFSIEVLKKIKEIDDFMKQNGSMLKCPSQNDLYEQSSDIGSYDIGIAKIKKEPTTGGVKITAELKNTNPSEINADVRIYVTSAGSNNAIECPDGVKIIKIMSDETVSCNFELSDGSYSAYAEITPKNLCENCKDDARSNKLGLPFSIGITGLEECEPYSTERLGSFIAASGITGESVDKVLGNVSFRAHLIKDRFSPDFQNDFDRYARSIALFDAPNYYTQNNGLGEYFKDFRLFKFVPKYGEANPEGYALPGPGIYNVTINIKYKDGSWSLFKDGKPNAEIEIMLDKVRAPEPNSPLYYIPFDGVIGLDDGRVGYGVNFEGDVINVNDSTTPLKTITISGTTPIEEGNLKIIESRNFKRINVDDKGVVLKVERGASPQIIFSPSYATPVMMEISNEKEDAFAYYSIEIDGSAQDVGYSMAEWYGVGINCRSFSDTLVYDEFWGKADMHALPAENRKCSIVNPEKAATSYGFEFCNPVKFGKLYLQTVIYTPYKSSGLIKKEAASDDMQFIGSTVGGSQMSLNGAKDIKYSLESIEGIINLVKEGYICVGSSDAKAEFFWNPKAVLESSSFAAKQDYAVNNCIKEQ